MKGVNLLSVITEAVAAKHGRRGPLIRQHFHHTIPCSVIVERSADAEIGANNYVSWITRACNAIQSDAYTTQAHSLHGAANHHIAKETMMKHTPTLPLC